jgi:RNA polymerase sigma factor for flagellar operon FliA
MATQVVLPGRPFPERGTFVRSDPQEGLGERRPARTSSVRPSAPRQPGAERKDPQHDELVVNLLPLVSRIALRIRRRLPPNVEVDDLISGGVLGLLDAVRKFDTRRHVGFQTYARYRIRGAIMDGVRSLDTASRHMRKRDKEAETVYHALEAQLRRAPSDEEMAEALGVSLEKWFRLVWELQQVGLDWLRPLESVGIRDPEAASEETLVADNAEHQFDSCYRQEQRTILKRCLARIPERERKIVLLHYERDITFRKIAKKLGVHESRVSQLHSAALARLQERVEEIMNRPQSRAPRLAM